MINCDTMIPSDPSAMTLVKKAYCPYNWKVTILATLSLAGNKGFYILSPSKKTVMKKRVTLNKISCARLSKLSYEHTKALRQAISDTENQGITPIPTHPLSEKNAEIEKTEDVVSPQCQGNSTQNNKTNQNLRPTRIPTVEGYSSVSADDIGMAQKVIAIYENIDKIDCNDIRSISDLFERLSKEKTFAFDEFIRISNNQDVRQLIASFAANEKSWKCIWATYFKMIMFSPDSIEHGLFSRWWLHAALIAFNKHLKYLPVELLLMEKKDEISSFLKIKDTEEAEEKNCFDIREDVAKFAQRYFFTVDHFKKEEEMVNETYLGENQKSNIERYPSYAEFDIIFDKLAKMENCSFDFYDEELNELHRNIKNLWLPVLPDDQSIPNNIVSGLQSYYDNPKKFDILRFLYYLMNGVKNYYDFYIPEKEKYMNEKSPHTTKRGRPSKKFIFSKESEFYRCCINIHNRNVEKGYKGNGTGSPRNKAIKSCSFLMLQRSRFERYYRQFMEKRSTPHKKMLITGECCAMPNAAKCPFCQ